MDTQMLLVIEIVIGKNNQKYPFLLPLLKNHHVIQPQECDSSLENSNQLVYTKSSIMLLSE